jgi:hypothetical protein|uniref:FAM69 protein-kinase domain-containing protein n=1 Tax=Panagrolaimus sp. PS1159 TaxID=55785 RepID=A0AC35GMR3_9BILA
MNGVSESLVHLELDYSDDDDIDNTDLPDLCPSKQCLTDDNFRPLCIPGFACSRIARLLYFMIVVILIFFFYSTYFTTGTFANQPQKQTHFNLSKASNIIGSLCAEYSKGNAAGGLCPRLCTNPNYTIADLYDSGAKVVIKFQSDSKDNILKMDKAFFTDYDQLDFNLPEENFTDLILDIVNDRVMLDWSKKYKKHLIEILWPTYNGHLTNAERASLWALVNQDEFINFKLLHTSRALPKVIDTCGHMYQVEYLIPFRMKGYYMNLKAKILLHLVGTLKLFDEFLNEPLQFCDVKFENLGLSGDYPKRFVIMDADMLYTTTKLRHMLTTKQCVRDTDCAFFDCDSKCDATTGYCTDRLNDNIDVFCKKLVNKIFGNFWSKNNRYLAACHETPVNQTKRLNDLRLVWAWSLAEV